MSKPTSQKKLTVDVEELKRPKHCTSCQAGITGNPIAFITEYGDGEVVCNCCGTIYREDGLKPSGNSIRKYMTTVRTHLEEYDGDQSYFRRIFIPLMWSFFQIGANVIKSRIISVVGSDLPLIQSFGLYNLAQSYGARSVATSGMMVYLEQTHLAIKDKISEETPVDSRISALFVTDNLTDAKIKGINPSHLVVVCIRDERSKAERLMADPLVYTLF